MKTLHISINQLTTTTQWYTLAEWHGAADGRACTSLPPSRRGPDWGHPVPGAVGIIPGAIRNEGEVNDSWPPPHNHSWPVVCFLCLWKCNCRQRKWCRSPHVGLSSVQDEKKTTQSKCTNSTLTPVHVDTLLTPRSPPVSVTDLQC